MRHVILAGVVMLLATMSLGESGVASQTPAAAPATRRSQRIHVPEIRVSSPNSKVAFTLLANAERLTYTVALEGVTVLEPSPIALNLDGYELSTGLVFQNEERYEGKETYPWRGARSTAVSAFNGARLSLINDLTSTNYTLDVRVFDDGVAYRHVIPGDAAAARVPDEYSTFNLPADATVWYAGLADGHYEAPYVRQTVADVHPSEWAGPPLTFQLPRGAGYAAITEANLVNYSGMGLESNGRSGWVIGLGHRQPLNYPFELRYGRAEGKRLGKAAAVTGTMTTPWRVVMVGRDLNALVTSTILANLCPPPDPALFPQGVNTPWIKPGRAVWRYVDGGPTGLEGMKEFSRLAGQLGYEHHVVEGLWAKWSMEERRELVEFSKRAGVGVWFWRHSRELRTPQAQDDFFTMLHELGAVGAKIDFFDHEAKEVIDLYETLLRKAAEHQILVDFHGANKPTGRERTWPNELVREAIRGMESSAMMERARHQTIVPFTRFLAGPAEYTTMLFSERRRDSTAAHQIASLAIFSSPLLTVAANPESILASPAVDVIKSIPATWDETIVLPPSEIGELAVYARRTGRTWFVAVMNGPAARSVRVPLTFLGTGSYAAVSVRDDSPDGATVKVETATQRSSDTINLDLRAGGGTVVRLSPIR